MFFDDTTRLLMAHVAALAEIECLLDYSDCQYFLDMKWKGPCCGYTCYHLALNIFTVVANAVEWI